MVTTITFVCTVASIIAICTTPVLAHAAEINLNFQSVQGAFSSLQEQMMTPTNVVQADPGLLEPVYNTAGFTASIIELVAVPTQNLSISGVVAVDNVLNQTISQLTVQSSLVPSTKTPVASYKGKYKGTFQTLNFQMVSKQLTCKEQDEGTLLKISLAADMLQTLKNNKFIGFSFVGSMLSAGYAQTATDGTLSAVFVSVFDGRLLAFASEDKVKTTMVQLIFTTYNGQRPASNEVTVPANLLSLCQ